MHQLEKTLIVLKPEYDRLIVDIFDGRPILERTLHDVADLDFKMKYLFAHQKERIESDFELLLSEMEHANSDMKKTWYRFTMEVVKRICNDHGLNSDEIHDVYMKHVNMSPRSMDLTLGVLSENKKFLEELDAAIPEGDNPYHFYEKEFFRYSSESYNEAIEKLYPERFKEKAGADLNNADNEVFVHNFSFQTSEDCNLNCTYCLIAGTEIMLPGGDSENIENIKVGDQVIGFEENNPFDFRITTVEDVYKRTVVNELYTISSKELENDLVITGNHPIMTERGWIPVADLEKGDRIYILNKHTSEVSTIGDFTVEPRPSTQTVYNFATDLHTYVADGVMVHNCFGAGTPILVDGWVTKAIEDIEVGDLILGIPEDLPNDNYAYYNHKNYEPSKVTHVFKNRAKCIKVTWKIYDGGVMYITPDHLVLLSNGKYVPFIEWWHGEHDPSSPILMRTDQTASNFEHWDLKVDETPVEMDVYNLETECHTYVAWDMVVHNCYQHEKSPGRMSFELGKEFVDRLLADEYGYINSKNSPAIILEFIGGEPLLEIELTRKIYEYFLDKTYKMNHPWFKFHRLSLCSNGLLYFDKKVQDFFKEYSHKISFNISIDGNKELHDSCRVQPNGEGSYDVDIAALNHFNKNYASERNSKMTLAPENISYLYDSVVNFINNGMYVINLNCVFEDVWTEKTAKIEYDQLKKLADYLIENNLENLYVAIFSDTEDTRWGKEFDGNFCFKAGTQVLTDSGHKNVENLRDGDYLYTASGSIHKVVYVDITVSDNNVRLMAPGIFPIYATSDHEVFSKKATHKAWMGEVVYSEPGFYPISDLNTDDWIGLSILRLSESPLEIDPELGYALGLYLGSENATMPTETEIVFDLEKHDESWFGLCDAGLCVSMSKKSADGKRKIHTIRYDKDRATLAVDKYFEMCIAAGTDYSNRRVPEEMFTEGVSVVEEMIRGVCMAQGIDLDNITKKSVELSFTSFALANDILVILRSLGYFPLCRHDGIYKIAFASDRSIPRGIDFEIDQQFPIMWTRVHNIIEDPKSYDVYCPTVMPVTDGPEEHTIIVQGVACVNCGGTGSMLSMDYKGDFYPCLRYMPSSIGDERVKIGNVKKGMEGRKEGSKILKQFDEITRRSQTNDICYDCPIGSGCAWCSALCFETYGTANKRIMFHCVQVIAEALANVYYWNNLILAHPEYELSVRRNNVPDSWALKVIDQDELDKLKELENVAMYRTIEYQKEKKSE